MAFVVFVVWVVEEPERARGAGISGACSPTFAIFHLFCFYSAASCYILFFYTCVLVKILYTFTISLILFLLLLLFTLYSIYQPTLHLEL